MFARARLVQTRNVTDYERVKSWEYPRIIIPPLLHFTILGQKNAQSMPRYYTVEQGKIRTEEEQQNDRTKRCLRPLTLTF